ncbi:Protein CBG27150 [Caenorhabditis briggsae]|uniref:Protein CBG27150 n=1 Tax=Caenorhabditis briggsae TaxID=6238 RepID=B6IL60_CAEBR|nr:Protein CBG27150 [Caenorhabditis briggsae]CAS00613.1 Protein CBG27150 [Caenorhabditis briggsae]
MFSKFRSKMPLKD